MNKTLLVVDDEPGVLGLMKRRLEMSGYPVVTAETGHEALDAIRSVAEKRHLPIAAVLLDLALRDMNGLEVLRQMKQIQPSLPVIMVTGSHDEEEARQAMQAGALEYLTKPVSFDYLLNVLAMQ